MKNELKQFWYWLWNTVDGFIITLFTTLLFILGCFGACNGQTFTQISSYPYVVTQVKYDSLGNEYVIRQQGSLTKNGDTIKVFQVQFVNECGLVGLELAPEGFFLHISGQDSVQRVIRFDTVLNILDTLVEVHYTAPFGSRHRGGGLFYADSVLYCSFGYGSFGPDAQDLDDYRGKLLKVNLNTGSIDIVAFGLRNPYRFDFNPSRNEGFIADPGTNIAEEINYFTGNYSLLNMGWPCYEDTIQLLDPDTLCSGYAYSFPEYSYSQSSPRSIIGGTYWNGKYYFTDHSSGFGGSIDTLFNFEQFPILFPAGVTSMTVNNLNELIVGTFNGAIYRYDEAPLSIDTVTEEEPPYTNYWLRKYGNMYITLDGKVLHEYPTFTGLYYSFLYRKWIFVE